MTILVWSCYPIVWLFSEGFASFSVSFEITMYAILDVINKVRHLARQRNDFTASAPVNLSQAQRFLLLKADTTCVVPWFLSAGCPLLHDHGRPGCTWRRRYCRQPRVRLRCCSQPEALRGRYSGSCRICRCARTKEHLQMR